MRIALAVLFLAVASTRLAAAQDLGEVGFRAGAGLELSLSNAEQAGADTDDVALPLAFGPAWQIDMAGAVFEVDLLYRQDPVTVASRNAQLTAHRLSLPVLMEVAIPGLSMLHLGAGIEPRLLLAADEETPGASEDLLEAVTFYLPASAGAAIDLGAVRLDLEARFEVQLSNHYAGPQADAARSHQLMFYVGAFL